MLSATISGAHLYGFPSPDSDFDLCAAHVLPLERVIGLEVRDETVEDSRDILRKDKGLNGDLDRLPMLTWIMFLKFLDDLELQREGEAKLAGKRFKPAIEPPQSRFEST